MKFYNFYSPNGYRFVIAYKDFRSNMFAKITYRDIYMPLGSIKLQNGYEYNFNTGNSMGINGCNFRGYSVINDSFFPKNFTTDFHDALVETMLKVNS